MASEVKQTLYAISDRTIVFSDFESGLSGTFAETRTQTVGETHDADLLTLDGFSLTPPEFETASGSLWLTWLCTPCTVLDIDQVIFRYRVRQVTDTSTLTIHPYFGGINHSVHQNLSPAPTWIEFAYTTNPTTGVKWTKDDLHLSQPIGLLGTLSGSIDEILYLYLYEFEVQIFGPAENRTIPVTCYDYGGFPALGPFLESYGLDDRRKKGG
jgi:hypothetical protein